jgi:GMP synthase (glutamine-hydrolysing)
VDTKSPLYTNLPAEQKVLLTHRDRCVEVAPGLDVTATCEDYPVGLENAEKKLFGLQYHPEVDLSDHGKEIMCNFLVNIAGLKQKFTLESRKASCIAELQSLITPEKKVLSLVSGGVDSAVCTALLYEALEAEQVIGVHIDNGFLRLNESDNVKLSFEKIGLKLKVVCAAHQFANGTTNIPTIKDDLTMNIPVGPLNCVINPEEKRKIIGDMFIKVVEAVSKELNLDQETTLLAQTQSV